MTTDHEAAKKWAEETWNTLKNIVLDDVTEADAIEYRNAARAYLDLLALLKRKSAALEEARRALRFVCHECDVDDVRTRPACWDALARIESLEQGKTDA